MTTLLFVNQWQTWAIILVVVLLLFGATRLPALSKSLGQSIKSFRKEMKDESSETAPVAAEPASSAATPSATAKSDADKE